MADIQGPTVKIGADASAVDTVLKSIPGKFQQLQTEVAGLGGKFEQVGQSMSKAGIYATAGITAPMAVAVGAVGQMTNQAADYQSQLSEVFTLMPGLSKGAMDQMSSDVKSLSSEYGIAASDVIPALYQAISAGVPADNVFSFLETSAQTSIGGVTDLTSAVDVLTSVTNAYGTENLSVSDAADILFTGAKMGKTTIGELSANMSKVAPIAASMGLSLDQVVSGLDSMTMQGEGTAEAATKLKSMLAELSQEGSKSDEVFKSIAGKSFPEFIAQGGSLQEALSLLSEAAQAQGGSVKNFFGSIEAGMGALMLTSEQGAQKYSAAMDEMDQRQGAALTAAETRMDNAKFKMDQIREQLHNSMLDIGEAFLPILQNDILPIIKNDLVPLITGTVVPAIKSFAEWFNKLDEPARRAAIGLGLFAGAIGPLLMVLGPLVSAGGSLLSGLTGITTAASGITGLGTAASGATPALAALFGPAGILAVGLGAGALTAYATNFGDFRDNINSIISDLGKAAGNIQSGDYEEAGRNCAQAFGDGFETAADLITAVIEGLPSAVSAAGSFISGAQEAGMEFGESIGRGAVEGISSLSGPVADAIRLITSENAAKNEIPAAIRKWFSGFSLEAEGKSLGQSLVDGFLSVNFGGLATPIKGALTGAFDEIIALEKQKIAELSGISVDELNRKLKEDNGGLFGLGNIIADAGNESERKPTTYAPGISTGKIPGSVVIDISNAEIKNPNSSSAFAAFVADKNKGLSDGQKYSDEALKTLWEGSDKIRKKYEGQSTAQTKATEAITSSTNAVNEFTKSLTPVSGKSAAEEAVAATTAQIAAESRGGGDSYDLFSGDPAAYLEKELKADLDLFYGGSLDALIKDYESYGKTLQDKIHSIFAEGKSLSGYGGDESEWMAKASPALNSFKTSLSDFSSIIGDGNVTLSEAARYLNQYNHESGQQIQYSQQQVGQSHEMLSAIMQISDAQSTYSQYMQDGSLSTQEAADMNSRLTEINRLLGEAGVTATGGVGGLPPALQSLASYASSAVSQINAAISSANAAVASAQQYITQANTAGQYRADPSVPASKLSDKSVSILIKDNVFGQTTTANDVLRSAFSQISAGL